MAHSGETGEVVGLHSREDHAHVCHRHHECGIVQADGLDARNIIDITADDEVGTRPEESCHDEGCSEFYHADAVGEESATEFQSEGIKLI